MEPDEFVALTVKMKPALLEGAERAQAQTGEGLQQFIRNSIADAVRKKGIKLPADSHLPRSRKGVGKKRSIPVSGGVAGTVTASKPIPRKLDLDNPKDLETMAKAAIVAAGLTPHLRPEPSSTIASPTGSESERPSQAPPNSSREPLPRARVPK